MRAAERAALMGERIRTLRTQKGLSQAALARALGASNNAINYLESGRFLPHVERLVVMAELFDVSLDYLCGVTDDPRPARRRRPRPDDDTEDAA